MPWDWQLILSTKWNGTSKFYFETKEEAMALASERIAYNEERGSVEATLLKRQMFTGIYYEVQNYQTGRGWR